MADQALPAAGGAARGAQAIGEKAPPYAYYALLLLVLANFFNYVDRNITSIVAHRVQQDLGFSDAQLGFILGTAFAVLYGVVGIAMGRIADVLDRTKVMAAGLALWSAMTALSGFAGSFGGLAAARVGVGIGEATANPCAHSLLSDYFPARNRAAVLGAYLVGIHLGAAGSLVMGGLLLQHWSELCTQLPAGACRIADWRAAFFAVGAPGVLLAVLIAFLRQPPRPARAEAARPLGLVVRELSAALPPFTFFGFFKLGGWPALLRNLALVAGLAAAGAALGAITGDWPQWIAVALGVYSVSTWAEILKARDRPLFSLTFGCPTFVLAMAGCALMGCFTAGVQVWSAPYAIRILHIPPGQAGLFLGAASAVSGTLSVILGGILTDRWKRRDPRAPMWVGLICLVAPIPALMLMMHATDVKGFVLAYFLLGLFSLGFSGGFGALVQDLVLPRMRATASAAFSLVTILVASGVGPYWAGKISTLTGSLTTGLLSLMALVPAAAVLLILTAFRLPRESAEGRRMRAAEAGEVL